jgi:EpsI family protein
MKRNLQFLAAAALLLLTAVLLQSRGYHEVVPQAAPLRSFPSQLGPWAGSDLPIEQDVLDRLGPGSFLLRRYNLTPPNGPDVDLFLAYFPSQRAGDTIHSPKNCLPGSGWTPTESRIVTLTLPDHSAFPANRYVVSRGDARTLVLYWYWAHDRGLASEYAAKFYLVADAIRMNRSDGSLLRLTTPMLPGETSDAAQLRVLPFAEALGPLLDKYIPR